MMLVEACCVLCYDLLNFLNVHFFVCKCFIIQFEFELDLGCSTYLSKISDTTSALLCLAMH